MGIATQYEGGLRFDGDQMYITTSSGTTLLTLGNTGHATFAGNVTTSNLFLGSSTVRISPGTNGEIGLNYNTSATGSLVWYAGGTASKFNVTNAGNATFAGTIGATNFSGSSSGTNTGDQTLPTLSSLGGASSGYLTNTGGAKLEIQNQQDGGASKGIYMWSENDANWGIYMAQAGDGKALNDGAASAGIDAVTGHAIRFRVNDAVTQAGFIWENSSNETLMQLNGGTEKLYTRNAIYPSNQTTNYVDSTRIANWQTAYGWGDHGLSAQDKTDIGNLSGVNTGDQTLPTLSSLGAVPLAGGKMTGILSHDNRAATNVAHWSASGNSTGSIKITLPGSHSGNWSMLVLRITAYEYNSSNHTVYYVSGHDWTSGWYQNGVTKLGDSSKDISLGYDDSKDYVILGLTSASWTYGHVTVDVVSHPSFYSTSMDISSGWAISQVTSLEGITVQSVTNRKVLTNADEGSGNGIDADTVDGIQAASFLRSDANDTASGTLTLSGTDWYLLGLGTRGASAGAYGIGNRNDNSYRQLTFHVPNQAAYASTGTLPSFGWYSNGAVQLMKLESDSGNLWLKGALDVDTISIGSTVTLTESTDRADLLYINSSTDGWGGLQVGNTSNEFIFSLMGNGNEGGIYDDQNGDWWIQWTENAGVALKYNTNTKLFTTDTGVEITGNIKVSGSLIHEFDSASGYIAFPKGAYYTTTTGSHTGAIKIKLPVHGRDDMLKFVVDIFDYDTGESVTMNIAGYLYQTTGNNEWTNCTVTTLTRTDKDYTVRFGADGTNNCLWIGETNSTWGYPQVIVRDFYGGYSMDVDLYDDNWDITFVTEFDTVDETLSDNLPTADWDRIEGKPTIPSGNQIIDWTTDQGSTNIHSGNYTNTTYSAATTSAAGLMSTTDKTKLDGIETGADVTDAIAVSAAGGMLKAGAETSTAMKSFEANLSNEDDWVNSPISILERGDVGSTESADKYSPNLNFHWGGRTSNSLWMNSTGVLHYGSYGSTGVPALDGTFKAGTLYAGAQDITATKVSNWNTAYGWGDHGLSAQDKTDIGNLSGTNTGDQDLSGYSTTSHNHDDRYYTESEIINSEQWHNLGSTQGASPSYPYRYYRITNDLTFDNNRAYEIMIDADDNGGYAGIYHVFICQHNNSGNMDRVHFNYISGDRGRMEVTVASDEHVWIRATAKWGSIRIRGLFETEEVTQMPFATQEAALEEAQAVASYDFTWNGDNNTLYDYSPLAIGTTATTALAGNTSLLTIGTTSTTAMAGNTSLFSGAYSSLSGIPSTFAPSSHNHDGLYLDRYTGQATGVDNTGYTTAFTVDGGNLASSIRFSVQGTAGNVVVSNLIDLVVNHSQDIMIEALSGVYTQLTIKVISNNNEDFAVELKTNHANAVTLDIEVYTYGDEVVSFVSSHGYTGASITHALPPGKSLFGGGGDAGDFKAGGDISANNFSGSSSGTNTGDQTLSSLGAAPLASPALTGTPTAPTAGATVNTTQLATTAFVQTAIANLSDSAPATLNTLNELAAALGDDASFSTTVATSIGTKLPLAGGTLTGGLTGTAAAFNSGAAYPLRTSSGQRYGIQVRNTANTVNTNYGWWWFMDTNFNMGFHADGAADRFTLTRGGDLTISGDFSSDRVSVTGSLTEEAAIHINNGRLRIGHHNSGGGVWLDTSSASQYWFAGLSGNVFRLWRSGNRFEINENGIVTLNNYGAGILKTNASGVVSLDTNTYSTATGVEDNADVTDTANVVAALTAGTNVTIAANGTISSTDTDTVYTHPTSAGNKHIPTGGSAGQFLKYSASGTATWATPSYTTNTNTTYSAGTGLDLSGTTFSVEPDLRDGITHVGKDSNNYIQFDSTNGRIDFYAGGAFVARMEAEGDLHIKGDVIAFSNIFS